MSSEAIGEEEEILASIGVRVAGEDLGELRAACTRIGRKLHMAGTKVVGFVPTDDRIAVPPLLIHLGLSLCSLTGATVAVVDANVRYPGLSAIARGQNPDHDDSVFSTRWLRGSLALLTPPRVELAGEVVPSSPAFCSRAPTCSRTCSSTSPGSICSASTAAPPPAWMRSRWSAGASAPARPSCGSSRR